MNDFLENILPGNYNLTKSMEISKVLTSGTLWYTKKFLVLYNIVFLTDRLNTNEYINEINELFKGYIDTMPKSIQEDARSFFYNGNTFFSLDNIKTYAEFVKTVNFKNNNEKISSESMSRKYYFAYLMGSGGQSGVKKLIKENMFSKKFKFSISNLERIINEFNINMGTNHKENVIINDYVAFIRNERQVLYYFGYFHSKTSGSNDLEFSSLTPVGEIGIIANSKEFHVLWEHQKIKMISQPINVEINKLDNLNGYINPEKFDINYSPYIDIIKYINKNTHMSKKEFQYILSKNKEEYDIFIKEDVTILKEYINSIEKKVGEFGRQGDVSTEDFTKELKKYTLGIMSDMKYDQNTNILGVLKNIPGGIEINRENQFNKLFKMYIFLETYKINTYKQSFKEVSIELKKYYDSKILGEAYEKDKVIKTNWNLYNGSLDKNISLGVIILIISLEFDYLINIKNINKFTNEIVEKYKTFCESFSINKKELKEVVVLFISNYENDIYVNPFKTLDELDDTLKEEFKNVSTRDLKEKIEITSERSNNNFIDRKRNISLISMMRSYYIRNYDDLQYSEKETTLKCESCKANSFITVNKQPYLEFHHIIPFGGSTKGQDHYLNLINLCPNCHTKIHRINRSERKKLYTNIDQNNYLNKSIKSRLIELRKSKLLKSYQLEFLYSEDAITLSEYEEIGKYYES